MRVALLLALVLVLSGGLAVAQDTESTEAERERVPLRERLRRAIRLPRTTEDSREAGVPEERVREVLRTGRENRVPPDEMDEILEAENQAIRDGGRPDNFGAAVQQMKASGLRGRELARAIHAEQVARGMKKPKDRRSMRAEGERGQSKQKGKGKGRDKN